MIMDLFLKHSFQVIQFVDERIRVDQIAAITI